MHPQCDLGDYRDDDVAYAASVPVTFVYINIEHDYRGIDSSEPACGPSVAGPKANHTGCSIH